MGFREHITREVRVRAPGERTAKADGESLAEGRIWDDPEGRSRASGTGDEASPAQRAGPLAAGKLLLLLARTQDPRFGLPVTPFRWASDKPGRANLTDRCLRRRVSPPFPRHSPFCGCSALRPAVQTRPEDGEGRPSREHTGWDTRAQTPISERR